MWARIATHEAPHPPSLPVSRCAAPRRAGPDNPGAFVGFDIKAWALTLDIQPPPPPPPSVSPPGPTGLRAAALKKCKKKTTSKARKKCKKKAKLLPV